jgi:hypothetical protein
MTLLDFGQDLADSMASILLKQKRGCVNAQEIAFAALGLFTLWIATDKRRS